VYALSPLSSASTRPDDVASTSTLNCDASSFRISQENIAKIANGGVAVLPNFVPPDLVERLRTDAKTLQKQGHFRPDGLTNDALKKQGFTQGADRQTFRSSDNGEQSWFRKDLGDYATRLEFDRLLASVRMQLAADLQRSTLQALETNSSSDSDGNNDNDNRSEITYNWYEPGAKLGRHLDEHHEETKGPRGWRYPTRRSVTWLLYLNDHWTPQEGGALLCHPRSSEHDEIETNHDESGGGPIGSHEGNLQVGWIDGYTPIYLDAFRESGQTALYSCRQSATADNNDAATTTTLGRHYWTNRDFDVPAQPIDFGVFLPEELRSRFEQISTSRKDPRFAKVSSPSSSLDNGSATGRTTAATSTANVGGDVDGKTYDTAIEVAPTGGTLVLFDSVTLPHSVLQVTGNRQRIAATGWFHEDSQFSIPV